MYMTQGVRRAAKITPDEVAFVTDERSLTHAQFQDAVARLAGALRELGLKSEDRVAMLAMNSDRYAMFYYGTFWAGGLVVPMNIRWAVPEHVYSINDSGARFLLVDDTFAALAPEIAAQCPSVEFLIHVGEGPAPSGLLSFDELIACAAPVDDAFRSGEDVAGIFYTGGTTGFPKGVMLPHRALWSSAMSFGGGVAALTPDDRNLQAAPLFHIAGSAMLFAITTFGGSHAIVPSFEASAYVRAIEKRRPTISLLVPTMISMMLQNPELEGVDTSRLTRMVYGASPMPQAVLVEAMAKMPETRFIHAYGQTELAPFATLLGSEYHVLEGPKATKIKSVGHPVIGTEVEIVDAGGQEVSRGTVGEVRVRGPNTMLGYWNKPEQTAETLNDGWIHTGDGGYMDEDGFIYIVDRVKDMIITGGENVYSAEVENAVMQYPGLAECAVIGIPDDKWVEAVHAIVVPRDGVVVDADAVIAHCRERIAGFKCPRTIEVRNEPLPKSGAGKIQKFELRAPYWEGRDSNVV
ncbi:MAG: long-chain-fatty-acid--CoA ligase [Hyphomicrobiaceae bacterium]